MSGSLSPENQALADRLVEMLRDAWPAKMTSTQLAEQSGLRRVTWNWCSGSINHCYVYQTRPHLYSPRHFQPTDYRYALDEDGRKLGWDEYEVDVSLQQVNPALNRLHKLGQVVKNPPKPGSRSILWASTDNSHYEEEEAEAMEILRQTIERARNRPPEPEPEVLPPVWNPPAPPTPPTRTPLQIVYC